MTSRYIALSVLAVSALLVAGCAKDEPTKPTTFALTGRVQLVGHMTADDGRPLGSRTVTDADGVPVDLLYGNSVLMRTHTTGGAFRFEGVAPGGYFARANIFGSLTEQSNGVTIASGDVDIANPLVLESVGDLYPAPNPVDTGTVITFASSNAGSALLRVLALDGTVVRTLYIDEMPSPGFYLTRWDGNDDHGASVPTGYYWMTYAAGPDQRAQLLFR
jgi:hypothetical protein